MGGNGSTEMKRNISKLRQLLNVLCAVLSHSIVSDSLRPMDCSMPGASVHGIIQARILEWVAMPFFRRSSQPRDWTQVSCIVGGFFTVWATKEARLAAKYLLFNISFMKYNCLTYVSQRWHKTFNGTFPSNFSYLRCSGCCRRFLFRTEALFSLQLGMVQADTFQ